MTIRIYEDKSSQWRWRFVSENGRIIADSSEGYTRREDVIRAMETVIDGLKRPDLKWEVE